MNFWLPFLCCGTLSHLITGHRISFTSDGENSVRFWIDVQAGGVLGPYSVLLAVCVVLAVAVLLRIGFRRYPSAKRDKRSEEER